MINKKLLALIASAVLGASLVVTNVSTANAAFGNGHLNCFASSDNGQFKAGSKDIAVLTSIGLYYGTNDGNSMANGHCAEFGPFFVEQNTLADQSLIGIEAKSYAFADIPYAYKNGKLITLNPKSIVFSQTFRGHQSQKGPVLTTSTTSNVGEISVTGQLKPAYQVSGNIKYTRSVSTTDVYTTTGTSWMLTASGNTTAEPCSVSKTKKKVWIVVCQYKTDPVDTVWDSHGSNSLNDISLATSFKLTYGGTTYKPASVGALLAK